MLILLGITTLSFVLSFLMEKLYSPIIGGCIFLLLIGSLALLIGKNHTLVGKYKMMQPIVSRRKRYKDSSLGEGVVLENLTTEDDHLLYSKSTEFDELIEPKTDFLYRNESTIDFDSIHKALTFAEVAGTLDDKGNGSYSTKENDEVHEEASIYKVNEDTNDNMNKKKELEQKASEELSDQWMQNRIEALFDDPKIVQNLMSLEEENEIPKNMGYDDLSPTYFNQVRSEKSGKKE